MQPESTCWTEVRAAAAGDAAGREAFAKRYSPVVRAYLGARWRGGALVEEIDDAHQEVFVELLKQGGGLERFQEGNGGGFRAFLFAVVRNVALRFERKRAEALARSPDGRLGEDPELAARASDETPLSRVFDRAWARATLEEAYRLQTNRGREAGAEALRRVDLLRLRFQEDLPIREIAAHWGVEAAGLHHEYARARREFLTALQDTVAFHRPEGTRADVEREVAHSSNCSSSDRWDRVWNPAAKSAPGAKR